MNIRPNEVRPDDGTQRELIRKRGGRSHGRAWIADKNSLCAVMRASARMTAKEEFNERTR